jgi:two-component system, NarL family, response regulator NreC
MEGRIRVLIVDDHAVVRLGIRVLLDGTDDLEPAGEASSPRDAVFETRSTRPDVVLLDAALAGGDELELIPQLQREHPGACVIVLAAEQDTAQARAAFAAGARGYVSKRAADEVVQAVREVAYGGRYLHPELGARLVALDTPATTDAAGDRLSAREREVLRLIALGHTNREIAERLSISVRTVETHRTHVLRKLRLSTRAELVRYAIDRSLLDG